jgi:hypothetical protein
LVRQVSGLDCAIHLQKGSITQASIPAGTFGPVVCCCDGLIEHLLRVDNVPIGTVSHAHV